MFEMTDIKIFSDLSESPSKEDSLKKIKEKNADTSQEEFHPINVTLKQ
ncbi:hypothetical protein J4861_01785 [Prevotella melaninogenica]|nr:hypothetical protein [Prevotella melaninogenica]QUB60812.1 hypothetical protein J4861_01785 [Prevotella melaninogenica]